MRISIIMSVLTLIIIGIAADAMRQRRRLNQFDELAELAEHMLD